MVTRFRNPLLAAFILAVFGVFLASADKSGFIAALHAQEPCNNRTQAPNEIRAFVDMEVGECGWAAPEAITIAVTGEVFLDLRHAYDAQAGEFARMMVAKTPSGFVVFTSPAWRPTPGKLNSALMAGEPVQVQEVQMY